MQVIEVRVRNQHRVDGRKIAQAKSWATQTLQNEDPLCEVGVYDDVLPANLQKETRMTDERDAELTAAGQYGLTGFACARRQDRTSYQSPDLLRFTSDCDACHSLLLDAAGAVCDAT